MKIRNHYGEQLRLVDTTSKNCLSVLAFSVSKHKVSKTGEFLNKGDSI